MRKLCIGLVFVGALAATPALAQSYVGGSGAFTGLGAADGYPATGFDDATFTGLSGVFTRPGTYDVDTVAFTAGGNSLSDHTDTGSFALTGSIGGNPFSYSLDYSIAIGSLDTLTLSGNTAQFNNFFITFNPITLTSGGETTSGTLSANVAAVPEPASWALMLAGFGMIGGAARYNRRKTAITYA